jgi:hypothetical protein
LWVNGEEREAAFAGRSQTREAYQKVAIQQRRDPVLVTTAGPDRVQMQCFPVPPNGGLMKIRIGITAPKHVPVFRKEVYISIKEEQMSEDQGASKHVDKALGDLSTSD